MGGPTITALVPTTKAWPGAKPVVDRLVDQVRDGGGEVLVVAGHPAGIPDATVVDAYGGVVRFIDAPANDVFTMRSVGTAAANGEVVALLEDHCFVPPEWCESVRRAFADHPTAFGIVGTVEDGTTRLVDRASFLLTWAPFLPPLRSVPLDRTPPPGVVVLRREALPASPPTGTVEYEVVCALRDSGRLVADDHVRVRHIQYLGWDAFRLQYHAGRGYTGLGLGAPGGSRRTALRRALGMPVRLTRQTSRAVRSSSEWRWRPAEMVLVALMATANAAGQVVGVLTGNTGDAHRHLE